MKMVDARQDRLTPRIASDRGRAWPGFILACAVALLTTGCLTELTDRLNRPEPIPTTTEGMSGRDIYNLARRYETADGVDEDIDRAAELYAESARRGYSGGSERLGVLAARGIIDVDDDVTLDRLNAAFLRNQVSGSVALARFRLADPERTATDIGEAIRILQRLVRDGVPTAMMDLAEIYANPDYDRLDYQSALRLYQQAYDAGTPQAALGLARIHGDSTTPVYRPEEARDWAQTAIDDGEPRGWIVLGILYADSDSPLHDVAKAENAYRGAILAGAPDGRRAMARFYVGESRYGDAWPLLEQLLEESDDPAIAYDAARVIDDGRIGNRSRAYSLYLAALNGGQSSAITRIIRLLEDDVGGGQAQAEALRVVSRSADRSSNGRLVGRVGQLHILGRGGASDPERGIGYLRRAIELGNTDAAMRAGRILQEGAPGVPADQVEAARLFTIAAEAGVTAAMVALGDIAADEATGAARVSEALDWYRRAADAGDGAGYRKMGDLAIEGRGGLTPDQALELYEQALALGDDRAGLRLARALLEGTPDSASIARALDLTAAGAEGGDSQAQYWHGIAQRFAGNYKDSVTWLVSAYQSGEERALQQIVTSASEGGAREGLDLDDLFADQTAQGSACERSVWYTLLGDLAARGAGPATAAGDYYRQGMRLGDPAAAAGMGRLYVTGVGLPQPDFATAYMYLTIAAESSVDGARMATTNLELLMSDVERARAADLEADIRRQLGSVCP